ncbi:MULTISPECIES: hypothetical protein [Pseudoalteromonas]|uniref:hypothetical protein n=1 Tax=Pseudoalteromonas TaxID=53246 RepID=UPI0009F6A880|nr:MULTISPECIES: hypothetical protein [Pseudoalteromonas]
MYIFTESWGVKNVFTQLHTSNNKKGKALLDRVWTYLFSEKSIVHVEKGIQTQTENQFSVKDVTKYHLNDDYIYVKHMFVELKGQLVKPKLSSEDINFFRTLDKLSKRCYVMVYIKNCVTKRYDQVLFLDDFEAIQGINMSEANKRLVSLPQAADIIRAILAQ